MKVNYQNNRDTSFNGLYNNKCVKKCLEFAAENGTLFAATTTLALSGIRPLVILATPNTTKKNKQVASAKSITSSLIGYLIALACSLPLTRAIKRIDKNPNKYLNTETIETLKDTGNRLTESKAYAMATQMFKLGLGLFIAAPKAILTALGTPFVLNIFETEKKHNKVSNNREITFQGKKNKLSTGISKIINNKYYQKFVNTYKDTNFPLHIIAATDTVATATFVNEIAKSKKLEKDDKKPLIYNSIISTALSISSTYLINHLTKDSTNKFINKFKLANKNDPKLSTYIDGIKIAKPILIAGAIYYVIIPIISTFMADRIKNK